MEDYFTSEDRAAFLAYDGGRCVGQILVAKTWNRYAHIEDLSVALENYEVRELTDMGDGNGASSPFEKEIALRQCASLERWELSDVYGRMRFGEWIDRYPNPAERYDKITVTAFV